MILEPARNEDAHVAPHAIPAGRLRTLPRPTVVTASGSPVPASTNVAIAVFGASSTARHIFETPVHAPFQPAKIHPSAAVVASVTAEPIGKSAPQASPQATPAGSLEMEPFPTTATASGALERGLPSKAAVTTFGPFMVTAHEPPPPEHAPPHETLGPAAVNVTLTPIPYVDVHDEPQLIPSISLVTEPAPATLTASA